MGVESRRSTAARAKKNPPPYFSHEFIISNHGDIMSCILMVIVVGFMFQATLPFSQLLVVPQYNQSVQQNNESVGPVVYRAGVRDIGALFFYTIVWITVHCIIQEFIIDKIQRRLHMSRSRLTRFSESAQLAPFALYSAGHALYILHEMGVHKDFSLLWAGYPEAHRFFPLNYKLFFIFQISFWLHQFPEFYFQKLKRDEIRERTIYSVLFLGFITAAYFANFTRLALVLLAVEYASLAILHGSRLVYFAGRNPNADRSFRVWNVSFIAVRLASMVISVLVLWYGLPDRWRRRTSRSRPATSTRTLNALFFLLAVQLYLFYQFARFHFARWTARSEAQNSQPKKKNHSKAKKDSKKTN
ncbi:TLC domain-containing protein [Aphelenchoides fujianensis]|nr:TLC domain-containing protein [Aphelenchoides fujianensis]